MTAILGVFPSGTGGPRDPIVRRMLGAMRGRGADRSAIWRESGQPGSGAVLAVSRYDWELTPSFAGNVLVLAEDDAVVAADASIYYRDDLRRAIERRGVRLTGDTASHFILAAYRAWGDDCAAQLEGDFAFVIWNRKTHRVCAARDFSGKRTLFYTQQDGALVIASSVGGVLAHPDCPAELNLTVVAETAGGLFASSHESCYRAIQSLPAAWTLVRTAGAPGEGVGRPQLRRHWSPPPVEPRDDLSFDDAGEALSELLQRAALERVQRDGPTSVWLSGGWDSPAVFGAGAAALRARGSAERLWPVSISYPPGDPGREDEFIQSIADHWSVPIHWIDIRDIPFFDRPLERAAAREEPFAHPFEYWLRSLARGSRRVGAEGEGSHVAFEGVGGDQLFQVSEVYLADLLRAGRWRELAAEWRSKGLGGTGFRNFFGWAVQPLLPAPALRLAALLRGGRPLTGYLERRPPSWLDRDFVRRHHLAERERAFTPRREHGTCVAYEMVWYLTHPYFPLVFGTVSSLALEEGVEIRSPLYDRRIVEFAVTRPRAERSQGRETKRLLRRAVRDMLPEAVLAPRPVKTGVTSRYFSRSMSAQFPALCNEMLRNCALARAGIIDAEELQRSSTDYLRGAIGGQVGSNLYFTLQTEMWLRARLRPADAVAAPASAVPIVMTAG